MNRLKNLLNNDNSLNKPKRIRWGGRLTKKFLTWNRQQIRAGKTNFYADRKFLYNAQTDRFVMAQYDKRYKKNPYTLKKTFKKRFNVRGSVLMDRNDRTFKFDKSGDWDELNIGTLKKIIKNNNLSGTYRILVLDDGEILHDDQYNVSLPAHRWWNDNINSFRVSSDYFYWDAYQANVDQVNAVGRITIIFSKLITIADKYFQQSFLDGVSHCVFTPMISWAIKCIKNAKSQSTKDNYKAILHKICGKTLKSGKRKEGLIQQYSKGVPEKDIPIVCEKLQIGIDIDQPFQSNTFFTYRPLKRPLKVFNFLNTRLNHIESSEKTHNFNYVYDIYAKNQEMKRKELYELKEQLDKDNIFYTYSKDFRGISAIRTMEKTYTLSNDYFETVKEFEKNNFHFYHYDALKYPKLHKFIMNGTHWNGTTDFKDTTLLDCHDDGVKHIDLKKAYTQYKQTKYYCGFMGKITDFRKVDNYEQVGYYYITHLNFDNANKKFIKLNEKLKWFVNKNIYSKGELHCLADMGATFKIKYGAYGIRTDFDLTDDMINKKEKVTIGDKEFKIAYYAKWTGMMGSVKYNRSIYMNGDDAFFQTLQTDYEIQVSEWDGEKRVIIPKHYVKSKRHIAGQIIAYQRLVMLEQLMKMDLDKLIRICVDGIYYFEHSFECNKLFVPKEKKTFNNSECERYLSHIVDATESFDTQYYEDKHVDDEFGGHIEDDYSKPLPVEQDDKEHEDYMGCPVDVESREFYLKELFIGAGGNGKTYCNLMDKGLINVCYVAPSWKLSSAKKKEFEKLNIDCFVHRRLFSDPYSKVEKYISRWNNYIIDEASMIIEGLKEYVFKHVKGKIIFCGDIGFQLPPVVVRKKKLREKIKKTDDLISMYGEKKCVEMTTDGFDNVTEMKKNYRVKCDKLMKLLTFLRKEIFDTNEDYRLYGNNTEYTKLHKVIKKIKKQCILIKQDEVCGYYNKKDLIICSEKVLMNEWTERFKFIEKYRVTDNTRDYCNGDIIFEKIPKIRCELRHGYTIHSVQGVTIPQGQKLFIDLRRMKSLKMIYTALSRARLISQIYIIL